MSEKKKTTVTQFRKMKQEGRAIVMVTAYDATVARLAEEAGIDMILVGDSVGMTQLGFHDTIHVTMDQMIHHCAAVRRGAPNTFVVGDMPFMSCQLGDAETLGNAARFMCEASCDAVKIEADTALAPVIEKMVRAGIPVMGHIGLLPQHIKISGAYRVQGRTGDAAERLIADAKALESAGVFAMVIECVPAELAKRVTEAVGVPTIGIGAGLHCSGQVQVVNDILGLSEFTPKHAKRYAELGTAAGNVLSAYAAEVRSKTFPGPDNSFE